MHNILICISIENVKDIFTVVMFEASTVYDWQMLI